MHYSLYLDNNVIGPMTAEQVMQHNVDANTQVSYDAGEWKPLSSYPELVTLLNQKNATAAPQAPAESAVPQDMGNKRIICAICAILVGALGIQYFVMGKSKAGLVVLAITFLSCGILSELTWLLGLAQGIYMLTLKDDQFYQKYIASDSFMPLF